MVDLQETLRDVLARNVKNATILAGTSILLSSRNGGGLSRKGRVGNGQNFKGEQKLRTPPFSHPIEKAPHQMRSPSGQPYYITVVRNSWLWFWCPCMAINVSVRYNGGLLSDIILLTPFDTMKSFCSYSQCSHLNILTISPLEVDAQKAYSTTVGFSSILYCWPDVTLRNSLDTMKSFCPYSQCSQLNLLTIFPLKVDAQKV